MTEWTMTDSPLWTLTPDAEARAIDAARRDPQAFAPLYRLYVRPIYRYLYSRTGSAADAEDLTSQVFIEALDGLPRYRHQGHFPAWLFTIARRRLLNFHHRTRPEAPLVLAEAHAAPENDPLATVVQKDETAALLRRITALDVDEQDLLRLRFVAELSFAEIAVLLGRSADAVKKQTYRLLARLQSQLEAGNE
jgi:RNA polymerase sigma-70 factor (ECF subfamily)